MRLRDPRPLGNVIVALLAVAVVAQVARVVLRAMEFRAAMIFYDLLARPVLTPEQATNLGDGRLAPGLIGVALVVFVLWPLQATVLVLWLFWQSFIRGNAKLLPGADPTTVTRRITALATVAVVIVIAAVSLYIARGDGGSRADPRTLVGLELALDLAVLSLVAVVAVTTRTWTQEQHRLVQAQG